MVTKEQILQEIHLLQKRLQSLSLKFNEKDVRNSVIDGFCVQLSRYYTLLDYPSSNHFLLANKEIYLNDGLEHIQLNSVKTNFQNISNSSLLINTWSEFELFIDCICNVVLTTAEKEKYLKRNYRDVANKVKREVFENYKVEVTEDFLSLKSLKKDNFHLIPSKIKIDVILKKIKSSYKRESEYLDDKLFLENYGRLRNCMHSNFVYRGKEDVFYSYQGVNYKFVPNRPLKMHPFKKNVFVGNLLRLIGIVERITDNIDYSGVISDHSFTS